MSVKYKRIVLKLSGEMLAGKEKTGITSETLNEIVSEIKETKLLGTEIAIVVGGGNIWRGAETKIKGLDRVTSDYMGMLATTINALALQSALEKAGLVTRVQSAIEIKRVCETFILRRAIRHLEKGRIVIFASGTGNPYFTTDTTAALRAIEIGADIFLKATKVDGVYSDDPVKNHKAKKYTTLTFMEAIKKRLKVMDTTAFSLCMENKLKVLVFDLHRRGNIKRAVKGENVGTVIY